jgi:hypothetical protein
LFHLSERNSPAPAWAVRKWKSLVSISKALIYAPPFAPPSGLKICSIKSFRWNNVLIIYSHPPLGIDCKEAMMTT